MGYNGEKSRLLEVFRISETFLKVDHFLKYLSIFHVRKQR